MTPAIPLPGETFDGSTVIASVYLRDDGPIIVVLVLLNPSAPYYRTVDAVLWEDGGWVRDERTERTFVNIVPAIEHYQQSGGDY